VKPRPAGLSPTKAEPSSRASLRVQRSRSWVSRWPRWKPARAAPPVEKNRSSRLKKAFRHSRWRVLSLLLANETLLVPAVEERLPEAMASPEMAGEIGPSPPDFFRRGEFPDGGVGREGTEL